MKITATNPLVKQFEENQQAMAKLNAEVQKVVGSQMQKLETLEQQNKDMRQAILEAMEANDVDKFDGDLITITRVKATTRTTFDSKRFADERPKTWAKYLKTGNVKASIRLKIKA